MPTFDNGKKSKALMALEQRLLKDKKLPLLKARVVFGEGSVDPRAMFIGEAPGKKEDETGRPFVGAAGKVLNGLLADIGWKRDDVYITSILKRRPPGNRDPKPEEVAAYAPYLTQQIKVLNPPVIVALGRFALAYFLPQASISASQGKAFKVNGRCVIPMFHPAAALYSPQNRKILVASFRKLPKLIKSCGGATK